jgi:hypothetical protein
MKYICLGYYDKAKFDGLPESERNAMFDACLRIRRPSSRQRALGRWRSASGAGDRALKGWNGLGLIARVSGQLVQKRLY